MKKKIDLSLSITEIDGNLILSVTNSGKSILNLEHDQAPNVRVIGYNQPTLTRDELIEFSKREADCYENGPIGALDHYVYCREKEMHNHVIELRKIMRKLVKSASSANAASAVSREISRVKKRLKTAFL